MNKTIRIKMRYIYLTLLLCICVACQSQTSKSAKQKLVGGPCEGCEAIFEYGAQQLQNTDTIPGFLTEQPKLKLTGTVFHKDGITPAKDVILYMYQTNREGIYAKKGNETGWARRHGMHRAWVKTGADGRYTMYTFRPASYPGRTVMEHIHVTVKEPEKNEYYIDDFVFEDDPLCTEAERLRMRNRGGSGIVKIKQGDGVSLVERDIILGKNIPDYNE